MIGWGKDSLPKPVIYIAAGLLFIGAAPLPYGYYTLLRIVATVVFVWAAVISLRRKYAILPWAFGILAVLFNPLLKIYLDKEVWAVIDISSAAFLIAVSGRIEQEPSSKSIENDSQS